MKYNSEIHHRKSIRLKCYDYSFGGFFVTICAKDRKCLFGEIIDGEINLSEIGKIAFKNWVDIPNHFENVEIDNFVIMPNHIHGIIFINSRNNYEKGNQDLLLETVENNIGCKPLSGRGLINQTPTGNKPRQNNGFTKKTFETNIGKKFNLMLNSEIILGKIIRYYKAKTTRLIRVNDSEYFQWQRNFHEWIIRDENHLNKFRNYIFQNPFKWEIDSENPVNNK